MALLWKVQAKFLRALAVKQVGGWIGVDGVNLLVT